MSVQGSAAWVGSFRNNMRSAQLRNMTLWLYYDDLLSYLQSSLLEGHMLRR